MNVVYLVCFKENRGLYRIFWPGGEIRFYVFLSTCIVCSFGFVVEFYLAVVL